MQIALLDPARVLQRRRAPGLAPAAPTRTPPAAPPLDSPRVAVPDAEPTLPASALHVSLAGNTAEREEAQRLRYLVFARELGAKIGNAERGIDEDEFDAVCDHLIVRVRESGQIIGTYRILTPPRRMQLGRMYADSEFDLTPLAHLRPSLVEVGRSCVHPDHRNDPALLLMWSGLTQYMMQRRYEHLIGCASAPLDDGGMQAATLRDRLQMHLVAPSLRVSPLIPFAHAALPRAAVLVMPPLIKGYLRTGARICGEPAWDASFHCADFLVWLSMRDMAPRYARHFGLGSGAPATRSPASIDGSDLPFR